MSNVNNLFSPYLFTCSIIACISYPLDDEFPYLLFFFCSLCIIAGDISPIDVISHLPILCEDFGIPYVFVPSKAELGEAAVTKRPTSCVLIVPSSKKVKSKDGKSLPKFDVEDRYNDALKEVDSIKPNFS